jgi:hypothetical protein
MDENVTAEMFDDFAELEALIFRLWVQRAKAEAQDPPRQPEHVRRERALHGISETLDFRPLSAFSASHLELLDLLLCYWLELTDNEENPA